MAASATLETATSVIHRAALKSDAARHTALTNVFTGRPARGIVNRLDAVQIERVKLCKLERDRYSISQPGFRDGTAEAMRSRFGAW